MFVYSISVEFVSHDFFTPDVIFHLFCSPQGGIKIDYSDQSDNYSMYGVKKKSFFFSVINILVSTWVACVARVCLCVILW